MGRSGKVVAVVLAVLVAAVALGAAQVIRTDPDLGRSPLAATTGVREPGAPLAEGLVVPSGALGSGPVFSLPPDDGPDSSDDAPDDAALPTRLALLTIEGEPLDVWDELAGQLQELGPAMPGSDVACGWWLEGGGLPSPLVGGGAPTGTAAVRCAGTAVDGRTDAGGRTLDVDARLWSDHEGSHVALTLRRHAVAPARLGQVWDDSVQAWVAGGPGVERAADADRSGAPRPERPPAPVGAGRRIAPETACGGGELRVPPRARLLGASGYAGGGHAVTVLAVRDARAALDNVARQADELGGPTRDRAPAAGRGGTPGGPTGRAGRAAAVPRRTTLADGRRVWTLTTDLGAGRCTLTSSPDGSAVVAVPEP